MPLSNSDGEITHLLDVLGFYCPVPLHETKRAIDSLSSGDVIIVRADDPETLHDIPMYLGEQTTFYEMWSMTAENFALSSR